MTPSELQQLAKLIAQYLREDPAMAASPVEYLDVHDAAKLLGISVPTLERRARSGEIPSVKLGKLRRYRRLDLLQITSTDTRQVVASG